MLEPTDQTKAEISTESEKCLFTLLTPYHLTHIYDYHAFF